MSKKTFRKTSHTSRFDLFLGTFVVISHQRLKDRHPGQSPWRTVNGFPDKKSVTETMVPETLKVSSNIFVPVSSYPFSSPLSLPLGNQYFPRYNDLSVVDTFYERTLRPVQVRSEDVCHWTRPPRCRDCRTKIRIKFVP